MPAQTNTDVIQQLFEIICSRKTADASSSYVASLFAKGTDAILKKVGEEATETVIAAKNTDSAELVYELADLWFHTLVLMADQGCNPQQILAELQRRMGTSGLAEKAARPAKK